MGSNPAGDMCCTVKRKGQGKTMKIKQQLREKYEERQEKEFRKENPGGGEISRTRPDWLCESFRGAWR